MKKYLAAISIAALAFSGTTYANQERIAFFYDDYTFSIPESPLLIAATGGKENLIILRYSKEKGKKYLSFSNMKEDKSLEISCDEKIFFEYVFTERSGRECNKQEVNSFRQVFVADYDAGTWRGENMTVHYSISDDQSFLFVLGVNGQAIKIDSDFLSKSELENIVKGALEKK